MGHGERKDSGTWDKYKDNCLSITESGDRKGGRREEDMGLIVTLEREGLGISPWEVISTQARKKQDLGSYGERKS